MPVIIKMKKKQQISCFFLMLKHDILIIGESYEKE